MTIDGTRVVATDFSVDMGTVTSDKSRRDSVETKVVVPGDLTLRGTTKPVELSLTAKRVGDAIQVVGNFEIVFADWGIPNPSLGPISTADRGLLELLLVFQRP